MLYIVVIDNHSGLEMSALRHLESLANTFVVVAWLVLLRQAWERVALRVLMIGDLL